MSSLTLRKHISLKENEYELIEKNARLLGLSFSEFLRKSALLVIEQNENLSLAEFLNKHSEAVSQKEKEEIEKLNIDYDDLSGEEMSIDDFL